MMKRLLLIVTAVIGIGAVVSLLVLLLSVKKMKPSTMISVSPYSSVIPVASITAILSPSPVISQTTDQLLQFVDSSLQIVWQNVKTSQHVYNKPDYSVEKIYGKEVDGNITYKNPSLHELTNTDYLQANGWKEDAQVAADGPNGSQWGYNKIVNGKKQVVIFSYTNTSFSPPPAQTTCPCRFSVSVFLSDPF